MNRLGINMQTVFGLPPVEHVELAADLGCGHISTALAPVPWKLDQFPDWSLRDDPQLRREMTAAMRDRGVSISLAEGFVVRPQIEMKDQAPDLDLLADLGARRASTVCMEPDPARSLDQLGVLAELTAERTMGLTFEFAPPHTFNTLEKALAAVRHIGRPNVRLLIDAMHFFRTGGTVADLAAIDTELIGYVQLCDAPITGDAGEDYYREASFERQCPGDGELPLGELLNAVPRDIPIGLEVPMLAEVKAGGIRAAVERLVKASRQLLDE